MDAEMEGPATYCSCSCPLPFALPPGRYCLAVTGEEVASSSKVMTVKTEGANRRCVPSVSLFPLSLSFRLSSLVFRRLSLVLLCGRCRRRCRFAEVPPSYGLPNCLLLFCCYRTNCVCYLRATCDVHNLPRLFHLVDINGSQL